MRDPDTAPLSSAPSASWVRANLSRRKNLKHDIPAGLVVFLVALPLCLGIALASGAPLFAGLITGILGGVVVSWFTGSPLSVSGPAAGLTVIVLTAIHDLGSFEAFLTAAAIAGVIQFGFGLVRAGTIAYYFPTAVIKGMLAAIGLILILKQIPHAIGFDADYEGDFAFEQFDGRNTLTEIPYALGHFHLGATIISLVGLALLVAMGRTPSLRLKWLPAPLVVVIVGIVLNETFHAFVPSLASSGALLVQIPAISDTEVLKQLSFPDFSRLFDPQVYRVAVTIAIVASLETLLCIEAMDRIDPYRRRSDTDKELRAQGIGNFLAGMLGGLPVTAVIVRGSANIQSGGRTEMASFVHGVLLAASVLLIPGLLNRIPLAALAAVLLHVGYKLSPPSLFVQFFRRGWNQFVPFLVTVVAIVFTDLLVGVAIGMATGIFLILRANLQTPYFMHRSEVREEEHAGGRRKHILIELSENVSFLNKASVSRALEQIPEGTVVVIDASRSRYIDRDVVDLIHDFDDAASHRGIQVHLRDVPGPNAPEAELLGRRPVHSQSEPREVRPGGA